MVSERLKLMKKLVELISILCLMTIGGALIVAVIRALA